MKYYILSWLLTQKYNQRVYGAQKKTEKNKNFVMAAQDIDKNRWGRKSIKEGFTKNPWSTEGSL